jgi:hypothetical protein
MNKHLERFLVGLVAIGFVLGGAAVGSAIILLLIYLGWIAWIVFTVLVVIPIVAYLFGALAEIN